MQRQRRRTFRLVLATLAAVTLGGSATRAEGVDTALVLAVDVSGSVDAARYQLQMEGIATAFEDGGVQKVILSGFHHSMLITLVEWSDRPQTTIPWTMIASAGDARAFAARVRAAERAPDRFTCMAQMMRFVTDKVVPQTPIRAARTVVDVSGDGHDNCNPAVPVDAIRDELVADAVTINGLPILEGEEAATLKDWYAEHVIGGSGAFLMPAAGFADVARAMRQKFITEISAAEPR
jgi:Protein of unknown function (DUF1194)